MGIVLREGRKTFKSFIPKNITNKEGGTAYFDWHPQWTCDNTAGIAYIDAAEHSRQENVDKVLLKICPCNFPAEVASLKF